MALAATLLLHGDTTPFVRPEKDPILRLRGWRSLGEEVGALRAAYPADYIIANNYANASELAFYMKGRPTVFLPRGGTPNQFSFWPGYEPGPGKTALYITNELDYPMPESFAKDFLEDRGGHLVLAGVQGEADRPVQGLAALELARSGARSGSSAPRGGTMTFIWGRFSASSFWNHSSAGWSPWTRRQTLGSVLRMWSRMSSRWAWAVRSKCSTSQFTCTSPSSELRTT